MTVTVQPPGALLPGVHISPAVNGGVELRCVAQSGRLLACLHVAADCYTDHTVAAAYAWLEVHDPPTAEANAHLGRLRFSRENDGDKPARGRCRARRPLELVRGGRYGGRVPPEAG